MFKLLLLSVFTTINLAYAIDLPIYSKYQGEFLFTNGDTEQFEGIVALSNCSASLVKLDGMKETQKAWVMTNGHCVKVSSTGGMIKPGEVVMDYKINSGLRIFDKDMKAYSYTATKVLYATMTKTDVAIMEIDATYADIANKTKIRPFHLNNEKSKEGTSFTVVSGYWKQTWDCSLDAYIFKMEEANYKWEDSMRYNEGCRTPHGSSGSPLIERGTRDIIGINNTGNDDGELCTMNNPCEIDTNGKKVARHQRSYAQHTDWLYTCVNDTFKFDMNKKNCLLPKPTKTKKK